MAVVWQKHSEPRPFAYSAFDRNCAANRLDKMFDDRQAEPGAAKISATAAIDAVEPLK